MTPKTALPTKAPTSSPTLLPDEATRTVPPTVSPTEVPTGSSPTEIPKKDDTATPCPTEMTPKTESPTKVPTFSPTVPPEAATAPPTLEPASNSPTDCPDNACIIDPYGSPGKDSCDSCVPLIILRDSYCGKTWDKWCAAFYAKCCEHAFCSNTEELIALVDEFDCPTDLAQVATPHPQPRY